MKTDNGKDPAPEAVRNISILLWAGEYANSRDAAEKRQYLSEHLADLKRCTEGAVFVRDNPAGLGSEGLPRGLAIALAQRGDEFYIWQGKPPLLPNPDQRSDDWWFCDRYANEAKSETLRVFIDTTSEARDRWQAFLEWYAHKAAICQLFAGDKSVIVQDRTRRTPSAPL